ncbi:hypothetical protein F4781DRAFT_319311 [Annulohypoxylon bovei var. microspora]|nr:hypothetical protein F4781DRAFT_319311 [Annulohypoxylon bovei var. microspora]
MNMSLPIETFNALGDESQSSANEMWHRSYAIADRGLHTQYELDEPSAYRRSGHTMNLDNTFSTRIVQASWSRSGISRIDNGTSNGFSLRNMVSWLESIISRISGISGISRISRIDDGTNNRVSPESGIVVLVGIGKGVRASDEDPDDSSGLDPSLDLSDDDFIQDGHPFHQALPAIVGTAFREFAASRGYHGGSKAGKRPMQNITNGQGSSQSKKKTEDRKRRGC